MDIYYSDLKRAVEALENYLNSLNQEDYNYYKIRYRTISSLERDLKF